MKENRKRVLRGVVLLAAFVLWTVLIRLIDVQEAGRNGSTVSSAVQPLNA